MMSVAPIADEYGYRFECPVAGFPVEHWPTPGAALDAAFAFALGLAGDEDVARQIVLSGRVYEVLLNPPPVRRRHLTLVR